MIHTDGIQTIAHREALAPTCELCGRPVEIDSIEGKLPSALAYCVGFGTCIQRPRTAPVSELSTPTDHALRHRPLRDARLTRTRQI